MEEVEETVAAADALIILFDGERIINEAALNVFIKPGYQDSPQDSSTTSNTATNAHQCALLPLFCPLPPPLPATTAGTTTATDL